MVSKAEQAKKDGNRLVQIGCTKIEDDFEITLCLRQGLQIHKSTASR
ncbi:MAG: hypothetical protein MZV70_30425 [Desulfobacterales bacterium]|nr:hypothetical protein [Desulfobacterales bacterium]